MQLIKNPDAQLPFLPLVLRPAKHLQPALADESWVSSDSDTDIGFSDDFSGDRLESHLGNPAHSFEDTGATLEDARAEAARTIGDAKAGAAEIERTAREKGMADARSQIAAQVTAELEPLRAQLAQSIEDLSELRGRMAEQAEDEMVQLALEIAKKVVHREVTVDKEIVISLARVALTRLNSRSAARIHLNPDHYEYVGSQREKLGGGNSVSLVEDPLVGRGGCLIETDLGDVDARIEEQFAEIERGFLTDADA